jgi:hypothetical protein
MRKFVPAFLLLNCGIFAAALLPAQTAEREPVNLKLFVSPLAGPDAELAKSVRAKLIGNLEKHGISITESKENADAILSGTGLMQAATNFRGRPHIHVLGSMRLVNKNGVALWAGDVSSGSFAISESASFVEKVTEKVVSALAEESKRRSSEPVALGNGRHTTLAVAIQP